MVLNWVVSIAQLLTLAALGLGVLACLPSRWRGPLLPLLPILGLALAVVVLHLALLVGSVRATVLVLPIVVVVLIVVGVVAHRATRIPVGRRVLIGSAAVALPSVLFAALGTFGSAALGLVQSSYNNDAFYYTSVARWLMAHSASSVPSIGDSPASGADSPAFGPAASTIHDSLRYGQELVAAWFTSATGIDLVDSFSPWSATWVALIGLAAFALARSLPIRNRWAVVAGLAVSLSAAVLFQVAAQNADSLAGAALALATLATVLRTVRTAPGWRLWLPGAVTSGLLLGALVGTYSEYLAFVGPVLVIVVLSATRLGLAGRLARGVVVVAASGVLAFWPWTRAVRNIAFISSIGGKEALPGARSLAYSALGPIGDVARVLEERFDGLGLIVIAVVLLVVVVGFSIALVDGRTRGLAIAIATGTIVIYGWTILRGNAYMVDRSSDLVTPFVVVVVIAGCATLIGRLRRGRTATRVVLAAATAAWIGANTALFASTQLNDWSERTVDADIRDTEAWVAARGGHEGSDVSVAVGDFFDQLWVSDALGDFDDVAYLTLRGDLGYREVLDRFSYWDGEIDQYLLVGPGAVWVAPDAAVVERNDDFVLIDTAVGGYIVAVPTVPNAAWAVYTSSDGTLIGNLGGSFLVLTDRDEVTVTLPVSPPNLEIEWALTASAGWSLAEGEEGSLTLRGPASGGLATVTAATGDAGSTFTLKGVR